MLNEMTTEGDQGTPQPEDKKPVEVSFQSAKELLGKESKLPIVVKRNLLFEELSESDASKERNKLIKQGICARCLRLKEPNKRRLVTNKKNILAHYCNVCTALLSVGTEFLAAMQQLDEIELNSIDEIEMEIIKIRDTKIYNTLLSFKGTLPK